MGGIPDVVATGIRGSIEAVTVDACAPGSTDTRGVGFAAAALFNYVARSRLSASMGLFANAPHSLRQDVFGDCRRPSSSANDTNQPPRRNHTSRVRDPGRACAPIPTPIEDCPHLLGNEECPHSVTTKTPTAPTPCRYCAATRAPPPLLRIPRT